MSQRDVLAELQAARVTAPPELRERIRLVAAAGTPPPRRVTRRRALVVAVPVAAAIAAAVVFTRPAHHRAELRSQPFAAKRTAGATAEGSLVPRPTPGRVQSIGTTLVLRIPTAEGVSDAVKRALAITASLGGYPAAVHAQTHGTTATATLTLKVPRRHVQAAMARLGGLGTITREELSIADRQAGLNATDREIARLQRQLKELRAQTPPNAVRIAAVTAHIQRLQRAEAQTRLTSSYATIHLALGTPPAAAPARHGELFGLALGLGAALVAVLAWLAFRTVRRRREAALLNRP